MLRRTYKFVLGDYLLRNSAILAIGALATGGLNYLFQLFAARILTVEEYGVFGAFAAFFYLVSFSSGAITLFMTKNTVLCRTDSERAYVLQHSLKVFGLISFAFLVLFLAFMPVLSGFLKVQSFTLFLCAGMVMALSLAGTPLSGFGRGIEDFFHTTISGTTGTLLKLLCGVGLVFLGVGVAGAFGGLIMGSLVTNVYLLICYRRFLTVKKVTKLHISVGEFLWYFFILFFSVLFIDMDMLLVKYYFSGYDAGMYAALSLIGKIVLFVAGATIPVIFPRVVKHIELREFDKAAQFFWKTIGVTALVGGAMVLAYALLPSFIVHLLYGTKYAIAPLLWYDGLFILLYVLLSAILMLAVALKKYHVLWGLIAGCIAQVGLVMFFHNSLLAVILCSTAAIGLSLVVTIGVLMPFFLHKPSNTKHRRTKA